MRADAAGAGGPAGGVAAAGADGRPAAEAGGARPAAEAGGARPAAGAGGAAGGAGVGASGGGGRMRGMRWGRFLSPFVFDLRAVGLFRVLLALTILLDQAGRLGFWREFHSTGAMLTLAESRDWSPDALWSLYWLSDHPLLPVGLEVARLAASLTLLVGVRSQLSAFVLFVLLASVAWRMPVILQSGDDLLVAMTFFACFLPLGARLSLERRWREGAAETTTQWAETVVGDAAGGGGAAVEAGTSASSVATAAGGGVARPAGMTVQSAATVAYAAQMLLVYLMAGLHKTGEQWWSTGTALSMALHLEVYATELARLWRSWDWLLRPMTVAIFWTEVLAPLLALVPRVWCRTAALAALVGLQVGISVNMDLGLFQWIALVALVPLTPPPVVDAVCGWWARSERVRRGRARAARLIEAARGGAVAAGAAGRRGKRGAAILRAAGVVCFGRGFGRRGYGGGDARRGAAGGRALRALASALALAALATVLAWNVVTYPAVVEWRDMRSPVAPLVAGFGLVQTWAVFSPHPPSNDFWHLIPALAHDGRRFDLVTGRPLNFVPPLDGPAHYGINRWRKALENFVEFARTPMLLDWHCRSGRWRYAEFWVLSRPNVGSPATLDQGYQVARESLLRCGGDETGVDEFAADLDDIRLWINMSAFSPPTTNR